MVGLPRSLFFVLAALSPTYVAGKSLNVTLPTKPSPGALTNVVNDNFLGISFELNSFDTLWGNTTQTQPSAIQNYLHNLRARMSNSLRIRVGGNSMDSSTYVPDQTELLIVTDPNAYFNDVPVDFGPVFFDVLNGMYDKVGSMQFIIGLSMQDPDSYANPVLLASAARDNLGDRLDAMLLGNEPDLYADHGQRLAYNISAYVPEVGELVADLRNASLLNDTIIGGPSVCCNWDLKDVVTAGLDEYPYKYYTMQHYPENICTGPDSQNTNITYFLSHMNVGEFVGWNQDGTNLAKASGVPVLLTEYNSVSCGGSNISWTFAATLWAVDVGLKSASSNFTAVYLHTREFNVTYNLFDPPSPDTSTEPNWRTGSVYYAALFLSETFSQNGSVAVDLNINNSNTSPYATVAAYGIYDGGGTSQGKLALLNYANQGSQPFVIPANLTDAVEYRILTAPDVTERTEISWAGQTVGLNGELEGNQTTIPLNCTHGCTVDVPGPGAALVLLHPGQSDTFFTGNSTIAGMESSPSCAWTTTQPLQLLSSLVLATILSVWCIF